MSDKSTIEEILAREGKYVSITSGSSMSPMLKERRDTVVIVPVSGRLKKYDVALYRVGEKYVLHRVVKVKKDSYVCCGDNRVQLERGITDADVLGRLESFYRSDEDRDRAKGFGYKLYSRYITATRPVRAAYRGARGALSRLIKGRGKRK